MSTPTITARTLASGRTVLVDERGDIVEWEPSATALDLLTGKDQHESCWKCAGTGRYKISGRVENGRFIGSEGVCFECQGKGYTNAADRKRNDNYNRYYRKVYL